MKKEILITILLGIFFLQQLNAQINNVKDAFLMVPFTQLPYEGSCRRVIDQAKSLRIFSL